MKVLPPGSTEYSKSLRPQGCARWFGASFLAVWLVGWVMGEVFAAGGLVGVAASFLPSSLVGDWRPKSFPTGMGAVLSGSFLLGWLSLWTVGGIAAIKELLRLLWSSDEISVAGSTLTVRSRIGLWPRTRRFERDDLRVVRLREHDQWLVAETRAGDEVVLTQLGDAATRGEIRQEIQSRLALPDSTQVAEEDAITLPLGWESVKEGESLTVLRRSWFIGRALFSTDYVIETRRFTRRRRFLGRTWLTTLEPASLELATSTDGDGDKHHTLNVGGPQGKIALESALHDSRSVVHLGRWIGARGGWEGNPSPPER